MKKQLIRFIALAFVLIALFSFSGCVNTKVTVDDIKAGGELLVATDPNFPPFEYIKDGNVIGWDMDIAQVFADVLGVELKIKTMDFNTILGAVKKGTVHIGMAGITRTVDREKEVAFTDAVFNSSQVIIVKSGETAITGPMSLVGKTVGVATGYIGELLADMNEELAFDPESGEAILGKPGEVKRYDSGAAAVAALKAGNVDAVIMDEYPANQFVSLNDGIKVLEESIYDDEYSFAVQKGNSSLIEFLNQQIKALKEDGRMAEITAKYFGD